jgi:membrane protein
MARGKPKKARGKPKKSALEQVVVPVASTVVLATAAVHSLVDPKPPDAHGHNGHDGGALHPASAPEEKSLQDRIGDKVPWLKPVLAIQKRYGEVGGNQMAAAFTFQAFVSLFPLVLVAIAVIGFVAADAKVDVAGRLIQQLSLKGEAANLFRRAIEQAVAARKTASLIGVLGLLWSGLGLVGALQFAYNAVWQVNDRGLKDKAVGLAWLAGAALLFVASAAATTALRWLPGFLAPVGILVTFLVSFALWLWTSRLLPNRSIGWTHLVPGALLGAVGLEVLKLVGAFYVPKLIASSASVYGPLGVVFAILAWLLLFGRLVVYSAVLNVVLYEGKQGTIKALVEAPPIPGARPMATRSGRLLTAPR